MRCAFCLLLLAAPAAAADRVLHVPAGFEVQRIAGPPLVERPVAVAFDDKGRLYVTESSGSNEPAKTQLDKKPHRVLRLTDSDGDGVFDKRTVFADQMMFPQGVMWRDGSLYVGAPPHIWKLTDTDNDGVADRRDIWFDGKTLTGCLNDLHGPYAGPDGYIYWTKGAFAEQTYTLPNGKEFKTKAAHVFRAKPDGTGVEPVFTAGMDNPVDVAFNTAGDLFVSGTFFQHPADGKRDGLIHAVYGGVWGKDHGVIHDPVHKRTSPTLMEPMTHLGPAAPCGLHCYTHVALGPEFRDNLFCCQFNLRTVSRHVLKPVGTTYRTTDTRFVWSDDMDFHPTDVIEDGNGSLIVVDTGGWYKLCCPSSQLVKPDVSGGIYRVRKAGAEAVRKPEPIPLPRLVEVALKRDKAGLKEAMDGLKSDDPHTRRRAATALGRIGDAKAIPAIIQALDDEDIDFVLRHALTYALIEIDSPATTAQSLKSDSVAVKRAVIMALSARPEHLPRGAVHDALNSWSGRLTSAGLWAAERMPKGDEVLADYFRSVLATQSPVDPRHKNIGARMSYLADKPAIQAVISHAYRSEKWHNDGYVGMANSRPVLKVMPALWLKDLTDTLTAKPVREEWAADAVLIVDAIPLPKDCPPALIAGLRAVAADKRYPWHIRLKAWATPPGETADPELFRSLLIPSVRAAHPGYRAAAWDAASRLRLTSEQYVELASLLPRMATEARPRQFDVFARSTDPDVGLALISALNDPLVRPSLRTEVIKPILDKYPASVKAEAEKLYAELDKARAGERDRLEALLKELPTGDVRRGQVVFNSQKAACASCHKIGYVGGTVGPDLTRIGGIRTDRDLLESIVFPSASFVRSYEPVRLTTKDGAVHQGVLKSEANGEVVLTVAADKEVRVPKSDVEELVPGSVSVMPAGLEQQVSKQELADLVAFLKACR